MQSLPLLDCAGRRRSPATTSRFHQGLPARNKGRRYPPDPPTVEEIVAVMRAAGDGPVRRRFAPHQLRHAHAVEMSREGISLIVIQRQLGHADLAITSRYLRAIDSMEIIQAVHERPEPMVPVSRALAPQR